MEGIVQLFGDMKFLAAVAGFTASIFFILWILHALNNDSEQENLFAPLNAEPEEIPQSELPTEFPAAAPAPEPSRLISTAKIVISSDKVTLETINDRISKLEKMIADLSQKIEQTATLDRDEIASELRAVVQSLKMNPSTSDSPQVSQLSSKIEKMYKVLLAMTNVEDK